MENETDPELQPALQPSQLRRSLRPKAMLVGAAFLTMGSVLVAWLTYPRASDQDLSAAEQMRRTVLFEQAGIVQLSEIPLSERNEALGGMKLAAPLQARLEQEIAQQRTELVWLTLWDDQAEDGDVVAVVSDGFEQLVPITHARRRIAVPRPKSGVVTVTGVFDGGGGITVALAHKNGTVSMPVMVVGQSVKVPVR